MSEKKRWITLRFLGYAIPMFLVVYILSSGPVLAFILNENTFYNDVDFALSVINFYAPMILVARSNTMLSDCFDVYMDFWNKLI
ncbi:hypothetical protein V144x_28450 [Gimesia aquarii]|uniref:Uncharacterized protein n=1 Tax=Gimesia aquarii TaxID=2527964 RepID=A0A517VWJ1_9PLAN|nr:hypothetical protein V144x_28450 [Gimesia aquarii]